MFKVAVFALALSAFVPALAQTTTAQPTVTAEQKQYIDAKIGQYTKTKCIGGYEDSSSELPRIRYDVVSKKTYTPEQTFTSYYDDTIEGLRKTPQKGVTFQSQKYDKSYWFLINRKGRNIFVYSEMNQLNLHVVGCVAH